MTLNPIQFGSQVVDQYGRYLASNFPIADSSLFKQFKDQVKHGLGGERFLIKGPYVFLNRPFEQGPAIDELLSKNELDLHRGLKSVFTFQYLHKHQENAIRSIKNNKDIIMTTGTGSGKTEGFLLPILDYCLKQRDSVKLPEENSGVVAILVYPMNALVNDQLKRFRRLLAGTRITFGRFTSETPERKNEAIKQLESPRQYTNAELIQLDTDPAYVPYPWEECISEEDIRKRKPRLLLTNYKQLEYLLSRYNDFQIFKDAPLKFIVFDEVHTYSGALGSEVACLTRRVKNLVATNPSEIICIGTSATISSESNKFMNQPIKNFASRFFGTPEEQIDIIEEAFTPSLLVDDDLYEPPLPIEPQKLLEKILEKSLEYQLQEEVIEISADLLQLAQELCGISLSGSGNMNKLYNLLRRNRLLKDLDNFFQKPNIFDKVLPILRSHQGRKNKNDDDLAAEVLAYLTLGAIARFDDEPLLRPKIHYFVRGLQGLWCTIENDKLLLLTDERKVNEQINFKFPLAVCRSCGQHYFRVFGNSDEVLFDKSGKLSSIRKVRSPTEWHDIPHQGEKEFYLTDRLVSEEESQTELLQERYMCSFCGTLHSEKLPNCQNDLCGRSLDLLKVMVWDGRPNTCAACGSTGRAYPTIRESVSNTVGDIMILAQDMLSSMTEKKFQKLLIFADNRQEAAYQAGWMKKRAERFRIRYFLYRLLHEDPARIWRFDTLVENILESAYSEEVLKRRAFDITDDEIYIRWILLEEFGTQQRKKGNIENLGLCEVKYDGIDPGVDQDLFEKWTKIFGLTSSEIQNVIRVLLDYCRRHNALSDPLFLRLWNYQDLEFRKGLIGATDYQKPILLLLNSSQAKNTKTYTMPWISYGLRSGVQQIVKKSIKNELLKPEDITIQVNNFLRELWKLLLKRSILVEKTIKSKRYGKIQEYTLTEPGFKINIEKIGICETNERYLCKSCKTSSAVPLPTMKCSQYFCNGTMEKSGREKENYDVVRYTQLKSIPIKPFEHTAQISKNDREKIENEFKKEDGLYNCLVASPTLELGVDIGALEMVLMRNAPPTPANYSQRAGRAGRRHRIAVVFTYTGMSNHDRYFFDNPPKLITGDIRIPSFSMQNDVIIRKHIHSSVHTSLLDLCDESEREVYFKAFPTFIWPYFLLKTKNDDGSLQISYLKEAPKFYELEKLIEKYFPQIMTKISQIFLKEWPSEDSKILNEEILATIVKGMHTKLEEHVQILFNQVKTYRTLLKKYAQKTVDDQHLTQEEERDRRKYKNALDTFSQEDQFSYTLTYLSNDGFFPGYGLARDQSVAKCLEPYQEIIRAPPVALREMTPATRIYANMNIFEVTKIDFYKFKKEDQEVEENPLFFTIGFDISTQRIFEPSRRKIEGAEENSIKFESVHLRDVELERVLGIDDRRDYRLKTAFEIQGILLNTHSGGQEGKIGDINYRYLKRESIRLVNLGPKELVAKRQFGFPLCHKCGETRNTFASNAELTNFNTVHQKRCNIKKINNVAFHIDFISDVLCLGPYLTHSDALNLKEAVLNRARAVLDMGEMELEGFVNPIGENSFWAVLYDPTPGGSGLLPQILHYWEHIVGHGIKFLSSCICKQSCYSCMKNYSNQPYHDLLDRHRAIKLFAKVYTKAQESFEIPMVVVARKQTEDWKTDSNAEQEFLSILEMHGFPNPTHAQYEINLNGEYTLADFAYEDNLPQKTILIFVDGLSRNIHGNPAAQQRDKLKRVKLRLEGYNVIETSARGLKDETNVISFLQELSLYLEKWGS